MDGIILLADGTKLNGDISGDYAEPAAGWLTANTGVVGFQQMLTDPVYQDVLLAFTYPEIGNTGAAEAFAESPAVQPKAVVVREICQYPSHYRAETALPDYISANGGVCLSGIDTRWLAVYLREKGEMPAVIAEAAHDLDELKGLIEQVGRPSITRNQPSPELNTSRSNPLVNVINLGVRYSFAQQLAKCCKPSFFPFDTDADDLLKNNPDAVIVSDGPAFNLPPRQVVDTLKALAGQCPVLACGSGNVALGMAFGCGVDTLKRGHHGANYPVRDLETGKVQNTAQRHSVVLNKESAESCDKMRPAYLNVNDDSIEGIRSEDGTALGYQPMTNVVGRDGVNEVILGFFANYC